MTTIGTDAPGGGTWPMEVATFLAGIAGDLHATYHRLRRHGPVVPLPIGHLVVGYDAASTVLREPGLRRHAADGTLLSDRVRIQVLTALGLPTDDGAAPADIAAVLDAPVLAGTGNATRSHEAIAAVLAGWRREDIAATTDVLARRLRRQVVGARHADLVRDFARPLAAGLTCQLLGVDPVNASVIDEMSRAVTRLIDPFVSSADPAVVASVRRLCVLAAELFGPDTRDGAFGTAVRSARLSPAERAGVLVVLMAAGHETILHAIGNLAVVLDAEADLARHHDPALVWNEVLRLESPVQTVGRVTSRPVEAGGVVIPADGSVFVSLGAANRDPDALADPDAFRPGRAPAFRHLSFGAGSGACAGARLAGTVGPGLVTAVQDLLADVAVTRGRVRPLSGLHVRGHAAIPVAPRESRR